LWQTESIAIKRFTERKNGVQAVVGRAFLLFAFADDYFRVDIFFCRKEVGKG
jgi:hypothetical protein